MAEVVGVALTAPGVIDVVLRGAGVIYERIDTFRHIDATMARFRDLTLNIKEGTLFFALTNLKAASSDRLIPQGIIVQLDGALDNVRDDLTKAGQGLSCVREDRVFGKLKYSLWFGEGSKSRLEKHFEALKDSCDKLKDLCLQIHQYRTAESCYLLTSDYFKIRHETPDNHSGTLLPDSDIWIAQGNYAVRGNRTVSDFVMEEKTRENDVRFLSAKLNAGALGDHRESFLPVLGYRQPPFNRCDGTKIYQLIVELPLGSDRSSLSHWLCTRQPLEMSERLWLCGKLAQATDAVHSIHLVHKALQPRSVLMLTGLGRPSSTAKAYLQDWTYIREISGATTEFGQTQWPKSIYQHPERQGRYAEAAFEPKHDIYSLGVCILEVLLWKPFVVPDPGSNDEELKVSDLYEQYGFARDETDGGLPTRYRGDSVKMTSRPWITRTIWSDIAKAELSNPDLTQLVLQCLDGNLTTAKDVDLHIGKLIAAATP